MRILCNECGKSVSTEVPDETVIRAWTVCPECIEGKLGLAFQSNKYKYCGCNSNWSTYHHLPKKYLNNVYVTSDQCPSCQYNYWGFTNNKTKVLWDKLANKL